MPEEPPPKCYQRPLHAPLHTPSHAPSHAPLHALAKSSSIRTHVGRAPAQKWGELAVLSNYTFLGGASHPEELVEHAARLGHAGIALTDFETFGGSVRAHVAAKSAIVQSSAHACGDAGSIRLAHGTRVRFDIDSARDDTRDDTRSQPQRGRGSLARPEHTLEVLLYATHRASWATLCLLLTRARSRAAADALKKFEHAEDSERNASTHPPPDEHSRSQQRRTPARLHDLIELLAEHRGGDGVLAVIVPPRLPAQRFLEAALGVVRMMPGRVALALRRSDEPNGVVESERACVLADALAIPVAAVNDIRMHCISRRPLLDTLRCIRDGTTLERAGSQIAVNAERRLRSPTEIFRRYGDQPEAIETAWRFLERASAFSLGELRYEYPDEIVPQGVPAMQHLRELVWKGARERYPRGIPPKVAHQFEHEFGIIDDLAYAPYFLTVQDIVAFARSRGILCQGRGAAANSAVCFALGITAVDPDRVEVLFERFVSRERSEPPDIDIDFEHERREEVIQHIYAKYGRHRAALVCEIISYRGKSAVRDVGKALGFAPDTVERLACAIDSWSGGGIAQRDDLSDETRAVTDHASDHAPRALHPDTIERVRAAGLDPSAPLVRRLLQLVGEILGFPRHRSQHVGGFVISRGALAESVPIENAAMKDRTVLEWDKDDIEALGMLKIDLLSLGMLTAIRKTIDLVNNDRLDVAAGAQCDAMTDAPIVRRDLTDVSPPRVDVRCPVSPHDPHHDPLHDPPHEELRFHSIPAEDSQTYDMMCKADTIGVFQIESRAQMSMLPRLRPRRFYDLVIEVALVRPGPIQGDMVHPYLRRRNGEEVTEYPNDAIRTVLGRTLGVPLFQEQAMALAVVAAGFSAGKADELRRAIAAWKRNGNRIAAFGASLLEGMTSRGYSRTFASQVFEQIKGFAGYGFPESHAASFALLVYASGWLKRHHPAAFTVALLNSQPLGFYAPAQLLRDAKEHGVAVRGVDIHCSRWDSALERSEDRVRVVQRMLEQGPHTAQAEAKGRATNDAHASRFERLHSRGRSGVFHVAAEHIANNAAMRVEPLCAPSPYTEHSAACSTMGEPSHLRFHVPSQAAIRLGMRMVRGLEPLEAQRICNAVARYGPFHRMDELLEMSGVRALSLRRLAAADAFTSMGLDRQQASWQILALRDRGATLWSFASEDAVAPDSNEPHRDRDELEPNLPVVSDLSGVAQDFESTGVSLKRHPLECIRPRLQRARMVPCSFLRDESRTPKGRIVTLAGLVLVRQRPSTAKGVVFMTIEDESGVANLIFRPKVYEHLRTQVRHATAICARGKVERRDGVVHVLVTTARNITHALAAEGETAAPPSRDFH